MMPLGDALFDAGFLLAGGSLATLFAYAGDWLWRQLRRGRR